MKLFLSLIWWSTGVLFTAPLFAAAPVKVMIAAPEFSLVPQAKGEKRVEVTAVDGALRIRAPDALTVILQARVHLPPANTGSPQLRRLAVRGHTRDSFAALKMVEVIDGGKSVFTRNSDLSGDFSTKEMKTNTWSIEQKPIALSAQAEVRLTIQFSSGFEGVSKGGWDFYLTGVEMDFPPTLKIGGPTVNATPTLALLPAKEKSVVLIPAPPSSVPVLNGIVYAVAPNNDLLWSRHLGREDGTFNWEAPTAKIVGKGWDVKEVFPGENGVIYTVMANGDLRWYRHDGRSDGSFRWALAEGKKVGQGWNFQHVFPGHDGVIYAITASGDLLWYRHDGREDGSFRWAANEGKKVGEGWNFKQVFAGDDGVIYAVTANGDLLWYRHDGRSDGSVRWAENEGKPVGSGWNFQHLFSAGNGVIYGVAENGDLMWYRHEGWSSGAPTWTSPVGKKVGSGWVVKAVFPGN